MEDEVTEHVNGVLVTYRNPINRIKDLKEPCHCCYVSYELRTHANDVECRKHDLELRQLRTNDATRAVRNSFEIGQGLKETCALMQKEVANSEDPITWLLAILKKTQEEKDRAVENARKAKERVDDTIKQCIAISNVLEARYEDLCSAGEKYLGLII